HREQITHVLRRIIASCRVGHTAPGKRPNNGYRATGLHDLQCEFNIFKQAQRIFIDDDEVVCTVVEAGEYLPGIALNEAKSCTCDASVGEYRARLAQELGIVLD